MEEGAGFDLAHHLGRALQLTNILRDIDEDASVGRLAGSICRANIFSMPVSPRSILRWWWPIPE
jgi:phytoene synthase